MRKRSMFQIIFVIEGFQWSTNDMFKWLGRTHKSYHRGFRMSSLSSFMVTHWDRYFKSNEQCITIILVTELKHLLTAQFSTFRMWSIQGITLVNWWRCTITCLRISSSMQASTVINLGIYNSFLRGLVLPRPLTELVYQNKLFGCRALEQNSFFYCAFAHVTYWLAQLAYHRVTWNQWCCTVNRMEKPSLTHWPLGKLNEV